MTRKEQRIERYAKTHKSPFGSIEIPLTIEQRKQFAHHFNAYDAKLFQITFNGTPIDCYRPLELKPSGLNSCTTYDTLFGKICGNLKWDSATMYLTKAALKSLTWLWPNELRICNFDNL